MLQHRLLFNLVVLICSQTAQSWDVVWFNPPAAGPADQHASDLAWQVGSTQTISCQSSYPTATLFLNRQHIDAVPQFSSMLTVNSQSPVDINLPWKVEFRGLDLQMNNTLPFFYFSLNASDDSGNYQIGTSHFINITANDAASNSPVSNSNRLSNGAIVGIVVGVVVGIVILTLKYFYAPLRRLFGRSHPQKRKNTSNIEERTNIANRGRSSVPSALRDTPSETPVGPPNPRRSVREDIVEDGFERFRRVREPRYGLNTQRRGPPAAHTRLKSSHAYLASEADTGDFIQMARRDRSRGKAP